MRALLLGFLFFVPSLFAQQRKGEVRLHSDSEEHVLYVAFTSAIVFEGDNYNEQLVMQYPELASVIAEYQLQFEKGIPVSDVQLQALSEAAIRASGNDLAIKKLKNILKVSLPFATNERLLELAKKLEDFNQVEYCALESLKPVVPPFDVPPITSNYESSQTYLGPDPGVNMNYAWGLGLIGSGIRVRDVEYGFNPNHEDLNQVNVAIASGMTINSSATTAYTEHGTPVFGIIMADKGTYGISGMAYGAQEMVLFPEWQQTGYSRVDAVTQAIANSQPGDVILYEMQAFGQGGSSSTNYVPAEYSQVIWDLTKAATDAGIIIVEAAANGNQDLDSAFYAPYMARGDSGAIIVGGGLANTSHDRISYSTYGSRVDVQGWAQNVFACGYGDLIQIGGDFNQGYTNFSGTSSATPMVAACVIVLQSYYFGLTGTYMTPSVMRNLLKTTGIPQGTGVMGNIGPLPNMQAAIQQIINNLSVQDESFLAVSIYPNPAENAFSVRLPEAVVMITLEVYDAIGRKVMYRQNLNTDTEIDIASLPPGMYYVKVMAGGKTTVKKLLKQ